jgi:hypothetical protein
MACTHLHHDLLRRRYIGGNVVMHNNNYIYPSIPYLQARTDNGIIGTENGIIGTENGIIGTLKSIIGTLNGIIGTPASPYCRHYVARRWRWPALPRLSQSAR